MSKKPTPAKKMAKKPTRKASSPPTKSALTESRPAVKEKEFELRIPYGIALHAQGKRDALSKKITDALKGGGQRENWGPTLNFLADELDKLEALAVALRKDPSSPVKLVSAANKLLGLVRDAKEPPRPSRLSELPAFGSTAPMSPPAAFGGGIGSALDEAMSKIAAENPAPPPESALPGGTDHRRNALMRLGTIYEIMRIEKPGSASVILQVIEDVKLI